MRSPETLAPSSSEANLQAIKNRLMAGFLLRGQGSAYLRAQLFFKAEHDVQVLHGSARGTFAQVIELGH